MKLNLFLGIGPGIPLYCSYNMGTMELSKQDVHSWLCLVIWVLKRWPAFGRDGKYHFGEYLNYYGGGGKSLHQSPIPYPF